MLARIRKATEDKDSGFTLIELLVVMIIIGILAAIAIPAFLNQKKKAKETSAKADVTTIGKEVAAFYVDSAAFVTVTTNTTTSKWELKEGTTLVADGNLSPGNTATGAANSGATCVKVVNGTDTTAWYYTATGLTKTACTAPTAA